MKTTMNTNPKHNGFAVEITDATDLGLAMLIAESEDGQYEPVAVVGTIREAREVAGDDLRLRMQHIESGDYDDAGVCPYVYKVWARGVGGDHRVAIEIPASQAA